MGDYLGIKSAHQLMKDRLVDYITSQYFGDNSLLLNAADELLKKEGNLFQKPFIESTPSYIKIHDGILNSEIDHDVKRFFNELIKNKLGVFEDPFAHQVKALENFAKGKNLFVATGTGSGKTECFMWPIIYKLINEAIHNKDSWKERGVRTIVIYPMNALVSDQISRLRSIIGDEDDRFINILHSFDSHARRPQFGMYTGRTPYSGEPNERKSNAKIATAYKNSYLVDSNLSEPEKSERIKEIQNLKKIHKYPSKDMCSFVKALEDNTLNKYESANDAELLLRYEMQQHAPDILITNYSMLEFMLFRKIEDNIWKETKNWLNLSEKNKLLIVIDEAHMYSGASGGEVALLLRRLFARLHISHNQLQFIMTSASMPKDDVDSIYTFVEDFTGFDRKSFCYLFGESEKIEIKDEVPFQLKKLADLQLNSEILDNESINRNICLFAEKIFEERVSGEPTLWLYKNFLRYRPFVTLLTSCRGLTVSYDELQAKVVGDVTDIGNKAFENLLLLAPLARDENNNVMFPSRIHLFFRGLNGIYACLNPNCKHHHDGGGLHLGDLFPVNYNQCPHCHSKVFELLNDRRCGSLYIRTYININSFDDNKILCWNKKGLDDSNLIEYPLFIVPENYDLSTRPKGTELAFFDFVSGKLYRSEVNKDTCIKVLRNLISNGDSFAFNVCPYCGKKFSFIGLSDFKVKGNIPFYTIAKAQFDAEPISKEPTRYVPNGGRKLLLFSDSRQSAALLARDMTKLADKESFRKAIFLAIKKIASINRGNEVALGELYPAFIDVCVEHNLRFFYGKGLTEFENDKNSYIKLTNIRKKRGLKIDPLDYSREFNKPCFMYDTDLLDLFCAPTNNFENLGLGYLAPIDDIVDDILDELGISQLTKEEFVKIFVSFVYLSLTDSFAFNNVVSNSLRREVKYIKGNRYGFAPAHYNSYINSFVKKEYPESYKKIYEEIVERFYKIVDGYYFLNLDTVKFVITDNNHKRYRCTRCGNVHPFLLGNACSLCGDKRVYEELPSEIKKINYRRKPVVSNESIKSLNTEEHTAQLSYNDERLSTRAKTEDYEMRFQDINVEKSNRNPIDILSCTTTMEVGIDIGSLTAIGLRNVPPLRENYQQRVGRAGRRGTSLSTITVYAQGGPHDTYYFNNPEGIIKGEPRKPWIDVDSEKIVYRHFNLIVFTMFFQNKDTDLYSISISDFKTSLHEFEKFVKTIVFDKNDVEEYFLGHDISLFRTKLISDITNFLNHEKNDSSKLFDKLFQTGILPTYSFPLDVIEFNIEGSNGETDLAPQRSLDIAISEYAPGRTIVVDKKTYKSGGIYSPVVYGNFNKPAEPYFDEENGYYKTLYTCSNPLCNWFGLKKPTDGVCPFCGNKISEGDEQKMLIPWGFAPLNGKEIPESEANAELTYADEPCYSATPDTDLVKTDYENLSISNRKDAEIIILNKGIEGNGFDVCRCCGAAQPHNGKTLKENGIKAPFTRGKRSDCSHSDVVSGIYLGATFKTDMLFMQINIDLSKVTNDNLVLKSASITLGEAMKLAASRILDINYNDIKVGTRIRTNNQKKYIDIYFYDSLSSGAGYSSQLETYLKEIFEESRKILMDDDERNICNFWNQRIQPMFNKKLAIEFLNWTLESRIPEDLSEKETAIVCTPLINILKNEFNINCLIKNDCLFVGKNKYIILKSFRRKVNNSFSIFDIFERLPSIVERLTADLKE